MKYARYFHTFIFWSLVFCCAALVFGLIYIEKYAGKLEVHFSQRNADFTTSAFSSTHKARVVEILPDEEVVDTSSGILTQNVRLAIDIDDHKQIEYTTTFEDFKVEEKLQKLTEGDSVVVGRIGSNEPAEFVIVDVYRTPTLGWIFVAFLALAILIGRARGLSGIVGLAISMVVIFYFLFPNILAGKDPILVSLVSAGIIAVVTMFFAHGFSWKTSIAILVTLGVLLVSVVISGWLINATRIFGIGSEEAYQLLQGFAGEINLKGLLLGSFLVGALGVLNDITISQIATVDELRTADTSLSWKELYIRSSRVGGQHIASLLNTLVLTYAGASFPLFVLFSTNSTQPIWALINNQAVAEEIVRTLIGGFALLCAVPITTYIAAVYFTSHPKKGIAVPSWMKFRKLFSKTHTDPDQYWDEHLEKIKTRPPR